MSVLAGLARRVPMYRPGVAGVLFNPFYIARAGLWRALARRAGSVSGRVLDLGCGSAPYRELFAAEHYVGVDRERRGEEGADALCDACRLPFADACFDAVVCNQVLEHVAHPDALFAEAARVLRDGGLLLLSVPFVWDEHEQPFDFHRFTTFGLRELAVRHGLVVVHQDRVSPDLGVVFQLGCAYLYGVTARLPHWLRVWLRPLLIAPLTLAGLAAARLLPDNPDLYLDQLLVARK